MPRLQNSRSTRTDSRPISVRALTRRPCPPERRACRTSRRISAAAPSLPTLAFERLEFAAFFTPAVNKKEKRRQPDEQGGPSKHPDFVGQDRFNLLRWKKSDRHCDRRRYHPAEPGKHQRKPRILLFFKILVDRDLQDRAKNV